MNIISRKAHHKHTLERLYLKCLKHILRTDFELNLPDANKKKV